MKKIYPLVIVIVILISSCHKTRKSTPVAPVSTGITSISGLSGIKFICEYETFSRSYTKYVTWNFSGKDTIIAKAADTNINGDIQAIFSGQNLTQVIDYNDSSVFLNNCHMKISYNPDNTLDSIDIYTPITFSALYFTVTRIAFTYYNGHPIMASLTTKAFPADTFSVSSALNYYYNYTGNNITQVIVPQNSNSGFSGDTINFSVDNRTNNFAGSNPTYLLLGFLSALYYSDWDMSFAIRLPFYFNENIISSTRVNNTASTSNIVLTDNSGRITEQITSDSTFYFY